MLSLADPNYIQIVVNDFFDFFLSHIRNFLNRPNDPVNDLLFCLRFIGSVVPRHRRRIVEIRCTFTIITKCERICIITMTQDIGTVYNLTGFDIGGVDEVSFKETDIGTILNEMASYAELAAAIREGVNAV